MGYMESLDGLDMLEDPTIREYRLRDHSANATGHEA